MVENNANSVAPTRLTARSLLLPRCITAQAFQEPQGTRTYLRLPESLVKPSAFLRHAAVGLIALQANLPDSHPHGI